MFLNTTFHSWYIVDSKGFWTYMGYMINHLSEYILSTLDVFNKLQ